MGTTWKAVVGFVIALLLTGESMGAAPNSEIVYPSFMWSETWNAKFLNELKDGFEKKNPSIKVNAINVPIAAFWDKQYADVTAGAPPDILTLYDPEIRQYIAADLLEPLDPWLNKAGFKPKDFLPSASLAVNQGQTYGVIMQVNPRALFYNEQMLKDAGVPAPSDLNSFYAALKKLRDPAKQQFGFATFSRPGAANLMYIEIMPLIAGFGGGFFRNGKPSVTSPETVAALEFYKKIYDEELIPRGVDTATYRQMFIQGKVAMYATGPFMAGAVAQGNPQLAPNLKAMELPFPGRRSFTLSVFLAIPKRAPNKEAAAQFLMTMLEDPYQKRVVDIIKVLPARLGMVESPFVRENPWFSAIEKAGQTGKSYAPEGVEEYAPEILKIIGQHIESMLFRSVDAKRVAANMQAELEKFVADKRK
jgi:multiple sugar transport system substrate-binding protein